MPVQRCTLYDNGKENWRILINKEIYVSVKKPTIIETISLNIRGLLEKYPTFGREKETGLLGALDT